MIENQSHKPQEEGMKNKFQLDSFNFMKFFLIAVIQLLCVAIQAQKDELIDQQDELIDLVSYNLRGNIKSIKQQVFEAKEENGTVQPIKIKGGNWREIYDKDLTFKNFQLMFNKQGELIQKNIFSDDTRFDFQNDLVYDTIGHLIKSNIFGNDWNKRYSYKYKYNYDEKGNLKAKFKYNSFGTNTHNTGHDLIGWNKKNQFKKIPELTVNFIYDSKKNLIKKEYINSSGNLKSYYRYKYSNNKPDTCYHYFNPEKQQYEMTAYKYDEKNRMISDERFDTLGKCMLSIKKIFDDDKKIRIETEGDYWERNKTYNEFDDIVDCDKYVHHLQFPQDSKGDSICSLTFSYTDTVGTGVLYSYEMNINNVKSESFEILNRNKIFYKYEYDKFNNWIRRIAYESGKPTELAIRKIEYYFK